MCSNQEWSPTSSNTSTFLDQQAKEQENGMFFTKDPYINVHTINIVYSAMLNLIHAMMHHRKLILTDFEGSKC